MNKSSLKESSDLKRCPRGIGLRCVSLALSFLFLSIGSFIKLEAQTEAHSKSEGGMQNEVPADIVVQKYELSLDLLAPDEVKASYQIRYRVNKPEGAPLCQFYTIIDKYRKLSHINMKLLDSSGNLLKEMGKKDLVNRSYAPEYSLVEDNRLLFLPSMELGTFPYYISLDYDMEYKSAFFLPRFRPVFTYGMALEEAVLKVKDSQEERTKFKIRNYPEGVAKELSNGAYEIRIKNVAAVKAETMAPPILQLVPWIELVPAKFDMDRTAGGFTTWENFGAWIAQLGNQKNELSQETVNEIKTLVAGAESSEEKARRIYQYLQDNTRYVSIQLGIGGFKPFSAGKVDKWGYGDCKALSNYMVTMLDEVGVEAYYTLIYSGIDNQLTSRDFPANNFNHVIVCLPIAEDTIWMECTNQILPFNYLGSSTSNRYALLIKGQQSQLIRTPQTTAAESIQDTQISLKVEEDGTLKMDLVRKASGEFLGLYSYLAEASADDTEEWLQREFGKTHTLFSGIDFSLESQHGQLSVHIVQPQAARMTGKYLFVPRSFENEAEGINPIQDPEHRKLPIYIHSPQTLRYRWNVIPPEGFEVSRIPKDVRIENKFGKLIQTCVLQEDSLVAKVELILNEGTYPPGDALLYNELAMGWKKSISSKWVFTSID